MNNSNYYIADPKDSFSKQQLELFNTIIEGSRGLLCADAEAAIQRARQELSGIAVIPLSSQSSG